MLLPEPLGPTRAVALPASSSIASIERTGRFPYACSSPAALSIAPALEQLQQHVHRQGESQEH